MGTAAGEGTASPLAVGHVLGRCCGGRKAWECVTGLLLALLSTETCLKQAKGKGRLRAVVRLKRLVLAGCTSPLLGSCWRGAAPGVWGGECGAEHC